MSADHGSSQGTDCEVGPTRPFSGIALVCADRTQYVLPTGPNALPLEPHRHPCMRHFLYLCQLSFELSAKGHVDFSWEVSRSMVACQGALLLVDASQGVQAQSLSVFHAARERGLKIIPVLNKVCSLVTF